MASIKKYNGSTFVDAAIRKYSTASEIITPPTTIYADGTNATVGLKGNMSQTGTPTPQNPIQPSETGDRTENLFDKDNDVKPWFINSSSHAIQSSTSGSYSIVIKCEPNTTLCCQMPAYQAGQSPRIVEFDHYPSVGDIGSNYQGYDSPNLVYSTSNSAKYVVMFIYNGGAPPGISPDVFFSATMVNEGSTALPYEPYGYKIPISSASTTTPVYLGEAQTTRVIKKLVLTGDNTENWQAATGNAPFLLYPDDMLETASGSALNWLSNQYIAVTPSDSWSSYDYCITSMANKKYLRFRDIRYNSLDDFKSNLAAQYALGTPVIVWYVLSSATTGILNDPIRKIGSYVDTVSGITIPTVTGADSFDVETTLKPSEVELTYTGWHDASVKEWDGSDWQ